MVKRGYVYILIGLLAIALFTYGCAKKEAPKPKEAKQAPAPDNKNVAVQQKVLSFNLEGFTQKGAKSWEVKGESAEAVSEQEVKLDNITAKAYGEEAEAVITADNGVYNKSKNNVTLENNVRATIENKKPLSADYEIGFADPLKSVKPKKDKTTEAKSSMIVITCDGAVEFNYEKNQVYFNKNVKIVSEDGNIDADRITINLDPATKKIRDIMAEDNVKITRGENVTYSDRATYIESEKRIILTGRPKLVIYQEGGIEGFSGSE